LLAEKRVSVVEPEAAAGAGLLARTIGGEAPRRTIDAALLRRIQGEFSEMPGLSVTADQAKRLWGMSEDDCRSVLAALVETGFLTSTRSGSFIRR
jgi:hypothetical protein